MQANVLRILEFDRIVSVLASLALTPTGDARLRELTPATDPNEVATAQRGTTEGVRFLADHPGFPLRAPADLGLILETVAIDGRALEPSHLLGLADYLDSIEQSRAAVHKAPGDFPLLKALVAGVASFARENAQVRRAIDASGEVVDGASPALKTIRERLRKQRTVLRGTLEAFVRGKDAAKYLQDQVVTDRNGRYVLVVRAEHRGAIPGIVHGGSASGASLFVEPLGTVEINNDIVALEEQEAEEVHRILLELTEGFRQRLVELRRSSDVATHLDVIQAKARLAVLVDGIEPTIASDDAFELRGARHPLLIPNVRDRESGAGEREQGDDAADPPASKAVRPTGRVPRRAPVPVDILLNPPARVLVITGPNTGGKTVAIKTAGLLAIMAQAGLHIPAEHGSRLPVFKTLFADIGDEQSISASLSTFSAHITNVVSMDRQFARPGLILLDEVGAGTDPVEGGALGVAVIDHFRRRGSHLVATTHYDALKTYASTTAGVVSAAFGFNAETFEPTYRLIYGSPGRSLAIEIAARLGMPKSVITAARENLSDREQQLAEHLAKVDSDLRLLDTERRSVSTERAALTESERRLQSRERGLAEREEAFRHRLQERLDDRVREARREIDAVIDALKVHTTALTQQAARKAAHAVTTGESGQVRAEARAAVDEIVGRLKDSAGRPVGRRAPAPPSAVPITPGARVTVGALGLEGTVTQVHDAQAEIEVRGKRLRAALRDLRVVAPASSVSTPDVRVNVDLQPHDASRTELNVIGCTVDDALTQLEKFLDEATLADQRTLRVVHGYGTGQLRRAVAAFLKSHPLVASVREASQEQGGGGATVIELKD
jgi:DNA mismatch repair protein MutS2